MGRRSRLWHRLLALAIGSLVFAICGPTLAQSTEPLTVEALQNTVNTNTLYLQRSIDTTWVLLSGFLVFFMQTGFALLEAGLVRQTGVVNTLMENFIDAAVTIVIWWAVGFGVAFGTSAGGVIGTDNFFLHNAINFAAVADPSRMADTLMGNTAYYAMGAGGSNTHLNTLTLFFFQFAFAATASTITTGSMAERTDFLGDLIYTSIMAAISYPIVVHWVWNSGGWLAKMGYHDFAGSSVVHAVGGWTALMGGFLLGPRSNRIWDQPPPPHNLGFATLGTMILWFGWYGFNPGSTLGMGNPGLSALVVVNTTLSAGAGAIAAMLYVFYRTGKWHLFCTLNGSLAGLVAITAGCAFVAPWAAVVIGLTAGVLAIAVVDFIESLQIDDPVGAFGVHGACGTMGTLAVGFLAQPQLTSTGKGGLFLTGTSDLLVTQAIGVLAIIGFTIFFSLGLFSALKVFGRLRVNSRADKIGIDLYEHGASAWPDVYPIEHQRPD